MCGRIFDVNLNDLQDNDFFKIEIKNFYSESLQRLPEVCEDKILIKRAKEEFFNYCNRGKYKQIFEGFMQRCKEIEQDFERYNKNKEDRIKSLKNLIESYEKLRITYKKRIEAEEKYIEACEKCIEVKTNIIAAGDALIESYKKEIASYKKNIASRDLKDLWCSGIGTVVTFLIATAIGVLTFGVSLISMLIGAILFSAVCALTFFCGINLAISLKNKIICKRRKLAIENSFDNNFHNLGENKPEEISNSKGNEQEEKPAQSQENEYTQNL